jgi:hypothetical protein
MGNQLRQVLRTYTTRRLVWVIVAFWVLTHVSLVFWWLGTPSSLPNVKDLSQIVRSPLLAALLLGEMVGFLLKLQFANPRARLVPHFAAAHLIVAGTILAAAVGVCSGAIAWAGGVSGLAVAGFALVAMAAVVWCSYLTHVAIILLLFVLLLYAIGVASPYIAAILMDGSPRVSLTEWCAGLAAFALLGRRLLMLHEGMPEYGQQMSASIWDLTSRTGRRNLQQFETQAIARSRLHGWLRDVEFRLVFRWLPARALLRRLVLRQLSDGFYALFCAPYQFGLLVFLVWLQGSALRTVGGASILIYPCFFLSFFPIYIAMTMMHGYLMRRWRHLARESLYPLTRNDLVGDLFRSSACDMAAVTAGQCAGIVVGLALFCPEGPLTAMALPYFAMTLGQYALAYCVILWLASFRRVWSSMLGLFAMSILSAALITAGLATGDWFSSPVNVALAVTAVVATVVVLYRLAFRRWCRVDLD